MFLASIPKPPPKYVQPKFDSVSPILDDQTGMIKFLNQPCTISSAERDPFLSSTLNPDLEQSGRIVNQGRQNKSVICKYLNYFIPKMFTVNQHYTNTAHIFEMEVVI